MWIVAAIVCCGQRPQLMKLQGGYWSLKHKYNHEHKQTLIYMIPQVNVHGLDEVMMRSSAAPFPMGELVRNLGHNEGSLA